MKQSLLPIDEINALQQLLITETTQNKKEFYDDFLDILILCYLRGVEQANTDLNTEQKADDKQMEKSVFKIIADKTLAERVGQYFVAGAVNLPAIIRVIETETHRVFNEGIFDTGTNTGKKVYKTWETMLDDKVRDTHTYLQSKKIPLTDEFFTYDGDSALYPGGFKFAQNNVNCRCFLELSV